jgi:hypothetical protein
MNTRLLKVGALLGLIFASGLVVGVVLDRRFRPAPVASTPQAAQLTPEQRVELRMKEFNERLTLSTNQQHAIRPILQSHQSEVQRLNATRRRRGREVFEQTSSKIRQQLTPEQQKSYDDMVKEAGRLRGDSPEEK